MKRNGMDMDQQLDQILDGIREDVMSGDAEDAVKDRVWAQVRGEAEKLSQAEPDSQHIRDCSDFQALIPAYLRGALTEAKSLLLEDHVGECLPCRKALKQARVAERGKVSASASSAPRDGWVSKLGWRVAAAAVVFLAVVGLSYNNELLQIQAGGVIHIESIEGDLFRVSDQGSVPVTAGQQITLNRGEGLRTAKGSRAMIRLEDASEVEMKERSEIEVYDRAYFWNRSDSDAVVQLQRGSVIIEASDQGSGNLFVDTIDSNVAVTGTVFAVNRGIKGTRVSVIEGEVEFEAAGAVEVVQPGQQRTSNDALSRVPLQDEIAWSQNLEKHLRLLNEVTELGAELDQLFRPGKRYTTTLLDRAPAETAIYLGIPNVSSALEEAHRVVEQRVQTSEALSEWWQEHMIESGGADELKEVIEKVRAYGDHLGDEVVVTLQVTDDNVQKPVLLAELSDPQAFRGFLEHELENTEHSDMITIVEGPSPGLRAAPGTVNRADEMLVWIRDQLLVVAFDRNAVLAYAAELRQRSVGDATDPFRDELRNRYRDGVEVLVGVDLDRILADTRTNASDGVEELGLLDVRHLFGEREEQDGRTENRVVLTFGQQRRGIAAWLDEPAPVGATEFISPQASLAAAFVMQEPTQLVDELFGFLESVDDDFESHVEQFEQEHDISIREDFAAPLGGEFAFALDGPVLPKPSWKLIIEVYNPEQLQQTLEWAVNEVNAAAREAGSQGVEISSETSRGRTFYRVLSLDTGISAYYTFVDGYLLAGPSRALLLSSIQIRDSGTTLTSAGEFIDMLPRDAQPNFSGVVYQNLGGILGPLARLGTAATSVAPEQRQLVERLASHTRPSLTLAYGEPERITFVYTHEGGLLSSGLSAFFSLQSLADMQELVGQSMRHGNQTNSDKRQPEPQRGAADQT